MDQLESTPSQINVELVYSPCAGYIDCLTITLPEGSVVAHALTHCGWTLAEGAHVGVWGRVCEPSQLLRDRDRVELYRPLKIDPKEARRQRDRSHRDACSRSNATCNPRR